jgi:hypothetical protein
MNGRRVDLFNIQKDKNGWSGFPDITTTSSFLPSKG